MRNIIRSINALLAALNITILAIIVACVTWQVLHDLYLLVPVFLQMNSAVCPLFVLDFLVGHTPQGKTGIWRLTCYL